MTDPFDNLTSSEQLRRLLLKEEQERIDRLESRVGDEETLKKSLIPIIADTLREAGVKDHQRLAGAIAPIVVQSIKTEIHNSRDMMVDALYPITGRLVAAAVRNAFKDLVDQLNSKLDSSLSLDRWRARIKAKLTGRSEAEILLSEGAAFQIIELLLINRQSGLLIARAGAEGDVDSADGHLLSSILTAIMSFVRDAMRDASEQDLRTLHVADMRLNLQVSPSAVLAIKTKGPPPAGFETALSETFYSFLSRWGDELSDPDQSAAVDQESISNDLEERFQSLIAAKQENFQSSSRKGVVLLSLLGLALAGWFGWTFYNGWNDDRIESRAQNVILEQSELVGYPMEVRYNRSDKALTFSGLAPSQQALDDLKLNLDREFPDINLVSEVSVLPDPLADMEALLTVPDFEEWRSKFIEDRQQALLVETSKLSDGLVELEQRLPNVADVEEAKVRQWLDRQTLKFLDRTELQDEAEANATLEAILDRLGELPSHLGLRIVGYGDSLGEERATEEISQERADVVSLRLIELGFPIDRLEVVGRGDEKRMGNLSGPGSINRRVEFELIHSSGEKSGPDEESDRDNATR
jgi:outer membrane protein OmpA-like peptidoglycan-associated protein